MDVIVKVAKTQSLSLSVSHVDIDGMINLIFSDSTSSMDAFNKLKTMGVRCFHAGKNSPNGPSVAICNNMYDITIK